MIVVSVTEHNCIHLSQVNPKFLRVLKQQTRLTGVHKKLVFLCLNIKAQSVLNSAARSTFRVFNKIDYAHWYLLLIFFHVATVRLFSPVNVF